jgi:hypothetical protein
MYAQFDLEVRCKDQKKKRPFTFHKFWSKEVHSKEYQKKENFDV